MVGTLTVGGGTGGEAAADGGRRPRARRRPRRPRRRHERGGGRPPRQAMVDSFAAVPARDRGHRQPGPRAGRDHGRRHQALRAHRRDRRLGGRARQDRRGLDLQRHGPRPVHQGRGRRQARASTSPTNLPLGTDVHFHGVRAAQLDGRRRPHHPGPDRAGRDLHLRVPGRPRGGRPSTTPTSTARWRCPNGMLGVLQIGDVAAAPRSHGQRRGDPGGPRARPGVPDGAERRRHDRPAPSTARASRRRRRSSANQGDWILVHYANEGLQAHPMHLHQFDQLVIAKDGIPLDSPYCGRHGERRPRRAVRGADPRSTSPAPGSGTATSSPTSRGTRACSAWSTAVVVS